MGSMTYWALLSTAYLTSVYHHNDKKTVLVNTKLKTNVCFKRLLRTSWGEETNHLSCSEHMFFLFTLLTQEQSSVILENDNILLLSKWTAMISIVYLITVVRSCSQILLLKQEATSFCDAKKLADRFWNFVRDNRGRYR